jgi:di/tricarboxylate transporter
MPASAGDIVTDLILFTTEMAVVLAILAFAIYLFVFEVVRVDVAAMVVLVLIGISGLIPATHVFDGFSSNAVISIIALMIMGAGLDRTGIMNLVAHYILKVGGSTERRVMPIVSGTVGFISSFMQNIGAAALFLPVVSRISTRTGIPLSRLLMPMGFCAILGGTLTMVGSSPLILLNDLIVNSNRSLPPGVEPMQQFHLFAVTPVGLVLLAAGIGYFMLAGKHVLPRQRGSAADPGRTRRYFENTYGIKGDIFEAYVPLDSPLAGMTVGEAEMLPGAPFILALKSADELRIEPSADQMIWVGSVFALMGTEQQVKNFRRRMKLTLRGDIETFVEILNPARSGIAEIVIAPSSNIIGKTLIDIGMRRRYRVNVLAVYREEETIRKDRLRTLRFRSGDTLVVHSRWDDLHMLSLNSNFVVVTDFPRVISRPHKVAPAIGFFALAIALVLFSDLRLSLALLVGAVGMILSGVLSIDEAYRSIEWQTVFLLACLLPLGAVMEVSGTASWIAQHSLAMFGTMSSWVIQFAMALLASAFTLVVSNVGATVLLVPLAVKIALGVGADPAMFALTVALATSNSFLLPTHQVNALIMGPAGYRVADFLRAGGIMSVLFLVVLLITLNLFY